MDFPPASPGLGLPRASVVEVTVAGLTLREETRAALEVGSTRKGVTLRIDGRDIRGDLAVMNVRRLGDSSFAVGCLFHPAVGEAERAWVSVISTLRGRETTDPLLALRCGSCHGSFFVGEGALAGNEPSVATCETCAQEYGLNPASSPDLEKLRKDARELARLNRIDLPAAYAVLLGITRLEHVRDLYGARGGEAAPTPGASEGGAARAFQYDREFREAIEAGWLTAEQAAHRGQRAAFVARLIEQHRLPRSLAFSVADNRLSLLEALRLRGRRERIQLGTVDRTGGSRRPLAIAAAVLLVLVTAGAHRVWRIADREHARERTENALRKERALEATRVLRDEAGRATEISGPDPGSILIAYCTGRSDAATLEPIEIAAPVHARAGVRLGIFADRASGDRYAIRIRREGAHRWIAGGSPGPIVVSDVSPLPPGTHRIPLR